MITLGKVEMELGQTKQGHANMTTNSIPESLSPPETEKGGDTNPPISDAKGSELIRERGFWKVIREDYHTHRKMALSPGFHAIFVYRFGTWVDTIRFKPLYAVLNIIWHLAYRWVRNFYGIEMEKTIKAGRRLELGHQHCIVIHANATIGDDVLIRHNVTFGMGNDWIQGVGPIIGNRVEFSPGVVLVGNVTIGDDVSVGPNCTVTTNVPSNRTLFVPPPRVMPKQGPPPNLAKNVEPIKT